MLSSSIIPCTILIFCSCSALAMSTVCSRRAYLSVQASICPLRTDALAQYRRSTGRHATLRISQPSKNFTSSRHLFEKQQQQHRKESFRSRLGEALRNTKIEWKPIPIGLGIGFLGLLQFYRVQQREQRRQEEESSGSGSNSEPGGKPKKRERIRPSGPWYIPSHTRY